MFIVRVSLYYTLEFIATELGLSQKSFIRNIKITTRYLASQPHKVTEYEFS